LKIPFLSKQASKQASNNCLTAALLLTLIFTFGVSQTKADVIYTYTGNHFTDFAGTELSTSNFLTVTMTFSSSLSPGLAGVNPQAIPSLVSWTFSDGIHAITNMTGQNFGGWLNTDGNGNIIGWRLSAETTDLYPISFYTNSYLGTSFGAWDCVQNSGFIWYAWGGHSFSQGTWTKQDTSAVPEPTSLLLLTAGLGAGLVIWPKKR
jgi:hypothetical protein